MDKTLDNHRKELIRQAIDLWDEKGDLSNIEKDPIIKLLFSALASQSHSVSQEIAAFQEMTINEFRNKMIPYYLIKPFPAYAIAQTKIKENTKDKVEPLSSYQVDEKCTFEFGKTKIPFTPLFNATIINATITNQQVNQETNSIELTLATKVIIDSFAGFPFYFEGISENPDIDISLNGQPLPIIQPDDYERLPFTDWFKSHHILAEENQLQYGCYDFWQELYLKNQVQLYFIDEYNTNKITNHNLTPVFTIHFNKEENLKNCAVRINCLPVVNVQKSTFYLTPDEPIKKLSTENSAFLNMLFDKNIGFNTDQYVVRHYGVERYDQKELLFQLNDLFNRFISDYYAFQGVEELKKGDKLETIYRTFKELLPVLKKNNDDIHPSAYAILKLSDTLTAPVDSVKIDYLTTHCEAANKIKKGEKPTAISEYLDKENTFLLTETAGGRNEERNEEKLNHLARYNLLTKDKLVTASDLKAFCFRELHQQVSHVSVQNTGEQIRVTICMKEEFMMPDEQEKAYYERLIQHKIKVRSLLCIPVQVIITG